MPKRVTFVILFFGCLLLVASAASQQDPESRKNTVFFNSNDLTGWKGNDGYWSFKDGAIVGHSEKNVPNNEYTWSDVEVKDFYLVVDVKLTPGDRNAGIQFRSKPVDAHGNPHGYQADVGHDQGFFQLRRG